MVAARKIAFLLIFVYLFSNNLWIVPFIEYYYNLDDIVKNYCVERDLEENLCMGSCYLNNQVKEAVKKQKYGEPESEKENLQLQIVSNHLPLSGISYDHGLIGRHINYFTSDQKTHKFKKDIPVPPPRV